MNQIPDDLHHFLDANVTSMDELAGDADNADLRTLTSFSFSQVQRR